MFIFLSLERRYMNRFYLIRETLARFFDKKAQPSERASSLKGSRIWRKQMHWRKQPQKRAARPALSRCAGSPRLVRSRLLAFQTLFYSLSIQALRNRGNGIALRYEDDPVCSIDCHGDCEFCVNH